MKKDGICCYIDILGFSNFVREDPDGAIYLLQNYQAQLSLFKSKFPKENEYLTPYRNDSFKYFIPFSDSIFFYSESPSDFALQVSSFIHGCFTFTADAFAQPEDKNHPEIVTEKLVGIRDGKVISEDRSSKWYPLLFRGGIGFGDARVFELNSIQNNSPAKTPVIFGDSVIEAVKFEQMGLKGPRLLCGKDFYDQLNERTRKIVHPAFDKPEIYEVNWTAINYVMTDELNDFFVRQLLTNDFYLNLLVPAANLWKAYNHLPVSSHYYNFLKLIIKGVQHYFSNTSYFDFANSFIKTKLADENLENKIEDLLN